jgi:hypothetical protein
VTVSAAFPLFVIVRMDVTSCPTTMFPKAKLPVSPITRVAAAAAGVDVVGAEDEPPQAETNTPRTKVAKTRFTITPSQLSIPKNDG